MPGRKCWAQPRATAQKGSDPSHPKATRARARTRGLPAFALALHILHVIHRFLFGCEACIEGIVLCFSPSLALCVKCSDCLNCLGSRFVHSIFHFCHPLPFHISNITRGNTKFLNSSMAPLARLRPSNARGFCK